LPLAYAQRPTGSAAVTPPSAKSLALTLEHAKTVFLINDAPSRPDTDAAFLALRAQLRAWNRFEIIDRADRADVTISLSMRQIERVVGGGGSRAPIGARFVNPETATVRGDVFTLTLRQRSTGATVWSGESATVTGALQRMQLALPRVPTLCVVVWCW